MGTISLQHANQQFSKVIASVEKGETFVITRRGKPVARIVPHEHDKTDDPEWLASYRRMMARLEQGARLKGLRIDRDELYDR